MEAFGEHWVLYTAREGYGELLSMGGRDLPTFLQNLDNLHTRVGLSFPELRPPSFHCSDLAPGSLRLHYYSTRAGLGPMVLGLVKGLGIMLHQELTITMDRSRDDGHDHEEFLIIYQPASTA